MNNFDEANIDMMLPDLMISDPVIDEVFKLDEFLPVPDHPDLIALSRQLDNLTIEGNTQSLQLKIERMKRRQLRSSLRSLEQTVQRPCVEAQSLKQELIAIQENQNAINYQFEGDMTAIRALTFRCLTRMYQMMNRFLSHIVLTPDDDFELSQMMQEIAQTFQQFHNYYITSYV